MFIIQVKHDPNMENFVDMAEEEEPAAAKQRMKQLVGEYQSEGRIVEVKAEAKMQYSDYFDNDKVEKVAEEKIATPENEEIEVPEVNVEKEVVEDSPCMRDICRNYDDGECESFDDIDDPIINSEGRCQGFDSIFKMNSDEIESLMEEEKEIIEIIRDTAEELKDTPTLSQVVDNGVKRHRVYTYFDNYKEACKIAGLVPNKSGRK
jgi:hypothetical protein